MLNSPPSTLEQDRGASWRAMKLSLVIGFGMLFGKVLAYRLTGSAAILSDAAESVIHVVAVAFATVSLRVSHRPADSRFRYGYERIAFFSAGVEGALIILAATTIISAAIQKWLSGLQLDDLGAGALLVAGAAGLNGALGFYLVQTGKRTGSLILRANGLHVLTDCWTSVGVVGGLLLVIWTGWKPFDPIVAILVAANILYSGATLVRQAFTGLMDYSDPAVESGLERALATLTTELGIRHHGLRFRHTGHRVLAEVHLLFPFEMPVGEAHGRATQIEERVPRLVPFDVEIVTHLEAVEDHERVHHNHLPR